MSDHESFAANREAQHEMTAHPEIRPSHAEAIRTYLAGVAYAHSHRRLLRETDEQPRAVDEPLRGH